MKSRDPLLYEQLIGQYVGTEEAQSKVDSNNLGFSSVLLDHVQALQNNELYNLQKVAEVRSVIS